MEIYNGNLISPNSLKTEGQTQRVRLTPRRPPCPSRTRTFPIPSPRYRLLPDLPTIFPPFANSVDLPEPFHAPFEAAKKSHKNLRVQPHRLCT